MIKIINKWVDRFIHKGLSYIKFKKKICFHSQKVDAFEIKFKFVFIKSLMYFP